MVEISRNFTLAVIAAVSMAGVASAQVVPVESAPQVGSPNPATPEPPIARPATTPCVVSLLQEEEFEDYTPKNISYAPPAACPGPWAKVVFVADFTVSHGRQYDRTANIFLGNVPIFYGTTAEPGTQLSPSWKVERDVTDLSALFKAAHTGAANLGNTVNSTYTGIIYANAKLEFYPVPAGGTAPATPDFVTALNTGNSAATLSTTTDALATAVTLPLNTNKVYLDVIAQSQSGDEFWYTCVPTGDANELESCGNTAFREVEVSIDGEPAGVAPVYPWIYTGGIDPYLWKPIVGIQTLDFQPYRVDLTPFAGKLASGGAHTVSVSVYNANNYFLVAANLVGFLDKGAKQVTGGIVLNTLSKAPSPQVTSHLTTSKSGTTSGTLSVYSNRNFTIEGFVIGSKGRIVTTVQQSLDFANAQTLNVNAHTGVDDQTVQQLTTLDSDTTTQRGSLIHHDKKVLSYPLTLDYAFAPTKGGYSQSTEVRQKYTLDSKSVQAGMKVGGNHIIENIHSKDTIALDSNYNILGTGVGTSHATYESHADGVCFSRSLQAVNHLLSAKTTSYACP